jgi:hypothetical protein
MLGILQHLLPDQLIIVRAQLDPGKGNLDFLVHMENFMAHHRRTGRFLVAHRKEGRAGIIVGNRPHLRRPQRKLNAIIRFLIAAFYQRTALHSFYRRRQA